MLWRALSSALVERGLDAPLALLATTDDVTGVVEDDALGGAFEVQGLEPAVVAGRCHARSNGPAMAGHGAEAVRTAITETITTLPAQLRRSLTWDQGAEIAEHAQIRVDTGLAIYFCDPQSPWQRGTNENTNRLLRQYFPKGTDLSRHTREDLGAVALALNTRPRKTLGWKTPAEALDKLLCSAR